MVYYDERNQLQTYYNSFAYSLSIFSNGQGFSIVIDTKLSNNHYVEEYPIIVVSLPSKIWSSFSLIYLSIINACMLNFWWPFICIVWTDQSFHVSVNSFLCPHTPLDTPSKGPESSIFKHQRMMISIKNKEDQIIS